MAHDVFISYAQEDKITADAVCATLEQDGIRCWIAPRDCLSGLDWPPQIIEAIESTRVVVLVFSDNANNSWPVKNEVEAAMRKEVPIIPLRIQNVPPSKTLEFFISTPHWLDAMTPPMEAHLHRLAKNVHALLDRTEVDPAKKKQRQRDLPGPVPVRRLPVVAMASGAVALIAVLFALWAIFGRGGETNISAIVPPQQPPVQQTMPQGDSTPPQAPAANPLPAPAPVASITPAVPAQPVVPQTLRGRVDAFIREGKFTDALSAIDTTGSLPVAEAQFLRGMTKAHSLDHKGAAADLANSVTLENTNLESRVWLAICQIMRGDEVRAPGPLTFVERRAPNTPMLLVARSMLKAAQWNTADAIADGKSATIAEPQNYMAWLALGNAYHAAGQVDDAVAAFTEAIRLAPNAPGPLAGRAAVRSIAGDLSGAEDDARRAISLAAPNGYPAKLAMYQVHMAKDDYARALNVAEEAVRDDNVFWGNLVARSAARILNNNPQGAVTDAQAAVRDNDRAETQGTLAWAHAKAGNLALAERVGNGTVTRWPNSPAAYNGRGLARLTVNKPADAIPDFEKLHELLHGSPYAKLMRATAQVLAYRTSPAQLGPAEADCKALVDRGAYFKKANGLLAAIYTAKGDLRQAAETLRLSQ